MTTTRRTRLASRLNSAAIHLLRRIAQADGEDGVTGARLSALAVLVYGGATTLGDLARRESVSLPTMSRLVDALVREGLVTRVTDASDRRAVRIEVTGRGRDVLERGRARRILRLAAELRPLTPADLATLEQAVALMERLEEAALARSAGSVSAPKTASHARAGVDRFGRSGVRRAEVRLPRAPAAKEER